MSRSLVGISLAVGVSLVSAPGRAANPALAPAVAPPAKPATPVTTPVEDLDSVDKVKALCLSTRPPDRVYFEGDDPAEKAKAKDAYAANRKAAMHKLYRASIPASGFHLGDYDAKANTLTLDLATSPRALHGALTLSFSHEKDITLNVSPTQVKDAAAAMKAGTATLVAYFELDDEQGAVCTGSAAAGVFNVAAEPVAFDLRDGMGQLVGRNETPRADRYRAVLGGYSGTPSAAIGPVDGDGFDAPALSKKLNTLVDPLRKCYVDRLKERPDVGGTVVIGVEVGSDGGVRTVTFIADALRDEPLRKCVDEHVKALKLNGVTEKPVGFLFRVPVEMRLLATR